MLLINRLTTPGGIKRIELRVGDIQIQTKDGCTRVYKLESVTRPATNTSKEVSDGSIHRFPVRP